MNSRQIIINLINEDKIDGEQAAILLNDIFQSELLESWKALNNKENHELAKDMLKDKGGYWFPSTWTVGTTTTNVPLGASCATTAAGFTTDTITANISAK